MAAFVLDCSMTLAMLLPDEASGMNPVVIDRLTEMGAVAPALWPLEVANCLLMAERRRRINSQFRRDCLADLSALPIEVDAETHRQAWHGILDLAERHDLTVYDAAYLELAMRLGLPLATLDGALRKAAAKAHVPLL